MQSSVFLAPVLLQFTLINVQLPPLFRDFIKCKYRLEFQIFENDEGRETKWKVEHRMHGLLL